MLDPIRDRIWPVSRRGARSSAVERQRRVSRREQELRQRRLLYIFTAIAGTIVIVALIAGASYQYWFYPRQALASVNGEKIERRDYWKVRDIQLRQSIARLAQQAQFTSPDQQQQLQQRITLAQQELEDVSGAPVASDTLSSMVDDLVVLQNLGDFGIEISDADMDRYIDEQFAPVPLASPTATATVEPTAAAWATGTAEAQAAAATGTAEAAASPAGSPTGDATEASGVTTPDATAAATGTLEATTGASPVATETVSGSPAADASPTVDGSPSPTESPTPNAEEALATSESTFDVYEENFLKPADISVKEYKRLIVKPAIARERIREQLIDTIPVRADQVRAAHILVATREAADEALQRVRNGEDFGAVAREVSTDTGTAGNGGDLGWFTREVMVSPFADAAFALEADQLSEPVQTEFGWHIIKVLEKEPNRPVSLATLQTRQGNIFEEWLDEQRGEADIKSDIALEGIEPATVEPETETFQPPPDAPQPPPPTPVQVPSPPADSTVAPEATGTP